MNPKLPVKRVNSVLLKIARGMSKAPLTQLEKFERLRQLCCTSDLERKRMEAEAVLGPKIQDQVSANDNPNALCFRLIELMDVRCKTAIVVGGASGVGYETCKALLKAGAQKVCVVDNKQDRTLAAVDKLNAGAPEPRALPLMADIRSDCAFDMAFREAIRCFTQVDIFINCVEMYDETPECWDQMVKLNLIGTIRGTILAYHYMSMNNREGWPQGGCILNVSSYGAIENVASMPIFSAASNGINGLTSSFGQDFHYNTTGVRCVTLCPSFFNICNLKKMKKYHYRPEWASHSCSTMKPRTKQTPRDVARAILHTIRYGLNGNIYAMVGGKFYRYRMPDYRKIIRKEAYLM